MTAQKEIIQGSRVPNTFERLASQGSVSKPFRQAATAILTVLTIGVAAKMAEKIHAQTPPPPSPQGIVETLPSNFPTSENVYRENVVNNVSSSEIKNSLSFSETLSTLTRLPNGTKIDIEYIESHRQDIRDTKTLTNTNGDVEKIYALHKNGYVYETHLDPTTGKFTEYKAISAKAPIENIRAIAVSSDAKTVFVGGEHPFRSGIDKLMVSFDGGKNFEEVPWNLVNSGGVIDLVRINDNVYFGNSGALEGGVGPFFIYVNKDQKAVSIKAATLEVKPTNIQSGGALNLNVTSIDPSAKIVEAYSVGSRNLQAGINKYRINYETAQGEMWNINTVKVNGVDTNLGLLFGMTIYKNSQGHTCAFAANGDYNIFYDVDLETKTATATPHSDWLNNRGLPDMAPNNFVVGAIQSVVDSQGKVHIWAGGSYLSVDGQSDHAVLTHHVLGDNPKTNPEKLTVYLLGKTGSSFIRSEKNMRFATIAGQKCFEITIEKVGKAVIPFKDGGPLAGAEPSYPNRGLGNPPEQQTRYEIYIPLVGKGASQ